MRHLLVVSAAQSGFAQKKCKFVGFLRIPAESSAMNLRYERTVFFSRGCCSGKLLACPLFPSFEEGTSHGVLDVHSYC